MDGSKVCYWERLSDDPNPTETHRVQFMVECQGQIAAGERPVLPAECPYCKRNVVSRPKSENTKEYEALSRAIDLLRAHFTRTLGKEVAFFLLMNPFKEVADEDTMAKVKYASNINPDDLIDVLRGTINALKSSKTEFVVPPGRKH